MRIKLPNKPSKLIELALKDLKKCEKSKKYKIDMLRWHTFMRSKCYVCLSGSVIAQTLKIKPTIRAKPVGTFNFNSAVQKRFSKDTKNKLQALNFFRVGEIKLGLVELGMGSDGNLRDSIHICRYKDNKKAFYKDMDYLVSHLKGWGY